MSLLNKVKIEITGYNETDQSYIINMFDLNTNMEIGCNIALPALLLELDHIEVDVIATLKNIEEKF